MYYKDEAQRECLETNSVALYRHSKIVIGKIHLIT